MSVSLPRRRPLLEIACFNQESAVVAAEAGADRIELCRDYASGGLSPYPETLAALKGAIAIPIYVMIRPQPDHFCYTPEEFESMKATVESFKEQGADGFVFGILHDAHDSEHQQSPVDIARNKALVELADGRPCTFHRAFDLIPDSQWDRTLGSIIDCGFKSILTSGGPSGTSAIECTDLLRQLIHKRDIIPGEAAGSPYPYFPQIIVGGGVRSTNAAEIAQSTGATAVHSAALTRAGETVDRSEVRALRATLDQLATKP